MTDLRAESIRVLQPGGTLGLTTWSKSGPFILLQEAQSRIPTAPKPDPSAPKRLNDSFRDPSFIRQTLTELGLTDVVINSFEFKQRGENARDFSRKMRHPVRLVTPRWDEEKRWSMFEKIEEIMKERFGKDEVWITSEAWIVTARKP